MIPYRKPKYTDIPELLGVDGEIDWSEQEPAEEDSEEESDEKDE